jgi:multisubunit Na+/H+ antiporter MnhG subunit
MPLTRIPEPAVIRGVLVAITGVAAYFLNREVSTAWIDAALTIYTLLAPIVAGLVIRPAVTPVKRLGTANSVVE